MNFENFTTAFMELIQVQLPVLINSPVDFV